MIDLFYNDFFIEFLMILWYVVDVLMVWTFMFATFWAVGNHAKIRASSDPYFQDGHTPECSPSLVNLESKSVQ